MAPHDAATIRKPRTDDRPLWDVVLGLYGYPAVLLAHRLELFPLLSEKARTLPEVCDALHIPRRPAAALLSVSASLGSYVCKMVNTRSRQSRRTTSSKAARPILE